MAQRHFKFIAFAAAVSMLTLGLLGCTKEPKKPEADAPPPPAPPSEPAARTIVYTNEPYGFRFTLPESWSGYAVLLDHWTGEPVNNPQPSEPAHSGPRLSLRHPEWTETAPRQDIPILVLTHTDWNLIQDEELRLGAAPIPPTELGRNQDYVFALPARYNYAFPAGHEEVTRILADNPLAAFNYDESQPKPENLRAPFVQLSVMVEQTEITLPFMLITDQVLPFSTYLFTEFTAEIRTAPEAALIATNTNPELPMRIEVMVYPQGTTEAAAQAKFTAATAAPGAWVQPGVPARPWAQASAIVDFGDSAEVHFLIAHRGQFLHMVQKFPWRLADAFAPVIEGFQGQWQWSDDTDAAGGPGLDRPQPPTAS